LRPVLLDIAAHYTTIGEICHSAAIDKVSDLPLDTMEDIAVFAKTMYLMLDGSNDNSFIKRIASGSGIPEARAAARAYARYRVFKDKENERMEAFMKTPEYKMQMTELRLGLRDDIKLPEVEENEQ